MRYLIALLFLVACGSEVNQPGPTPAPPAPIPDVVPDPDPDPQDPKGRVILVAFAAPWCGPCKRLIPQVQSELDRLPKAQRDRIDWQLWVTTGSNPSALPDKDTTIRYRDFLGLDASAHMDPHWRVHQKYIGGTRSIPAGAVLHPDYRVHVRYPGGRLAPKEMVVRAIELLDKL